MASLPLLRPVPLDPPPGAARATARSPRDALSRWWRAASTAGGSNHRAAAGKHAHPSEDVERARRLERGRVAVAIDADLHDVCRAEAAARLAVGSIASELLRRRAYRRLGFVRLSDYAWERLGVSARALESAAQIAARLESLPRIAAAFARGSLSWTQVRLLCSVAQREDETAWLARARRSTVGALGAAIAAQHQERNERPVSDPEDDQIDGEPPVVLRIACPGRVRWLWRSTLELASRVAGAPLAAWQAAEIIAAEGIASRPVGATVGDRVLLAFLRLKRRLRRLATGAEAERARATRAEERIDTHGTEETGATPPSPLVPGSLADAAVTPPIIPPDLARCDAFMLDRRLTEAMRAFRRIEPRLGRLLGLMIDHHLYRALGFPSTTAYVRERLGISLRKAWALRKIEKTARRDAHFAEAYENGTLSWVRALTLLPVVDRQTAPEWIARASAVTVRRLADEVNWVLDARDVGGPDVPLAPPPLDSVLEPPVQTAASTVAEPPAQAMCDPALSGDEKCRKLSLVQIGAGRAAQQRRSPIVTAVSALEVCDGEIRFTGPASVVALFRDALDAFSRPGAPRWLGLERLLTTVRAGWKAEPGHPDPVFARDGWRCAVPACSSRRNLHDHHIQFRSRGGSNACTNRVSVCAAHHLHGIHTGVIRAWGRAPTAVHWQLGVRTDAPPLLETVGDRLCVDA